MRPLHALWSFVIVAFVALAVASCGPSAPYCGDGACNNYESQYTCPRDCGSAPGKPGPGPGPNPGGGYCGDRLSPDPGGVMLPVTPLAQYCQQWCWAATITMVANYYGIAAGECQLASYKAGFSQPVCCNYAACGYQPCNQPAPQPQMEYILGQTLGIHGSALDSGISETAVRTELSNGRPIIVGYLNSFAGHVVVVSGYGPSAYGKATYHVIDPYNGIFDVTYDQLAYGYMAGGVGWRWGYTLMHLSPRGDGCNLDFDPDCSCE